MNIKLIITDALLFFRYHIGQIAALCLPWLLAIALVEYLVIITGNPSQEAGPLPLIGWTFKLLVYPIYTGALILLMAKRARLEAPANKELISSAIQIWQPLFLLHIITAAILVPGVMFILQGWVLFIIPIVYVAVRLSFAEFYLVLEKVKPLEAIRMSFKGTQPCFFQILVLLTIFVLPLLVLEIVRVNVLAGPEIDPLVNVLAAAVMTFFSLFVDVLLFRAYMAATQEQPK
jgi:hypothetical protein